MSKSDHLYVQKQQRSNSIAHVRVVTDEPLVEINLNRNFYTNKQKQDELNNSNLKSNSYASYSKSQTPLRSYESSHLSTNSISTRDDHVQKIHLYKDPNNSNRELNGLGMHISACQRLPELGGNQLAAVVHSIHPNGIIDKFNVEIQQGDEIMEINGVNLRNKSEEQIGRIIDSSCHSYNGELELLVRRSSISSNKSENRSSTPSSQKNARRLSKNEVSGDDFNLTSELNEHSSITSSPVTSEHLITHKPLKQLKAQTSSSSSSSATSAGNNHKQTQDQFDLISIDKHNFKLRQSNMHHYNLGLNNCEREGGEGRGFREISIKRRETNPVAHTREVVMTDPAMLFAINKRHGNLNQKKNLLSLNTNSQIQRASSQPPTSNLNKKFSTMSVEPQPLKVASSSRNISPPNLNLSRYRSASPYRKNSSDTHKPMDIKIKINPANTSGDFEAYEGPDAARKGSRESSSNDTGFSSLNGRLPSVNPHESELSLARRLSAGECSSSHSSRRNSKDDSDSVYSFNSTTIREHKQLSNLNQNLLNLPEQSTPICDEPNRNQKSKISFRLNKTRSPSPNNCETPFGEIQIQLSHNSNEQQIIVKILKARNLIAKDANGFSDPYVKVYLLPGRE